MAQTRIGWRDAISRRHFWPAASALASAGCSSAPETPPGPPGKSPVFVAKASSYRADLESILRRGIAACGLAVKGRNILLKPNLVEFDSATCVNTNVAVLTDDMYEHILFDGRRFATIAAVCPELKSRTLTLNGASKTYCMTGWRLGYAGGPPELIREMIKMLSQSTAAPSAISQAAAVAALNGPQEFVKEHSRSFEQRRDLAVSMLNQAKGLKCRSPEGAFYAFPDCSGLIGKRTPKGETLANDKDVVLYLLDQGVAAVQGSAYGLENHFRISFSTSSELITEACQRIQRACAALL